MISLFSLNKTSFSGFTICGDAVSTAIDHVGFGDRSERAQRGFSGLLDPSQLAFSCIAAVIFFVSKQSSEAWLFVRRMWPKTSSVLTSLSH